MSWSREDMCIRASKELKDGYYVNLGIGMPTQVANYLSDKNNITLQDLKMQLIGDGLVS